MNGIWLLIFGLTMLLTRKLGYRIADKIDNGTPWRCVFGFHAPFVDSALASRVKRCNYCDWVSSKKDAERLEREREMWTRHFDKETK